MSKLFNRFFFARYSSKKGRLLPLYNRVLVCKSSALSVILLLTGMG